MDPQYVEELKAEQVTITAMLQAATHSRFQRNAPGLHMTTEIYIQLLEMR